jgi:hypothetical protein
MHGAIRPLPQYVFMEWCLVKHRGKFTFNFSADIHLEATHTNATPTCGIKVVRWKTSSTKLTLTDVGVRGSNTNGKPASWSPHFISNLFCLYSKNKENLRPQSSCCLGGSVIM